MQKGYIRHICIFGLIESFKNKRRKRNIDREQEKRKNKYIMKRMSMVVEKKEVRMSAKEDFCVLLFFSVIATTHTKTHVLLRQNDVQSANECQHAE
jgi:hypothetical protein